MSDRFSRRYGYLTGGRTEWVYEQAPAEFRRAALYVAEVTGGLSPVMIQHLLMDTTKEFVRPKKVVRPPITSEDHPVFRDENATHIDKCEWYLVYDFCEACYSDIAASWKDEAMAYQKSMNEELMAHRIGWQMIEGEFVRRTTEELDDAIRSAVISMEDASLTDSRERLKKARASLDLRPEPDLKGAITHALAALEGLARKALNTGAGDTLGAMAKSLDLPHPLKTAVEKLWGYGCQWARHGDEDKVPMPGDAMLVLGLCSVFISYLSEKYSEKLKG